MYQFIFLQNGKFNRLFELVINAFILKEYSFLSNITTIINRKYRYIFND